MVYVFQTTIFGILMDISLCWAYRIVVFTNHQLVGGFNPSEQYESKWKSSPNRGDNKKIFDKSPTSDGFGENKPITKALWWLITHLANHFEKNKKNVSHRNSATVSNPRVSPPQLPSWPPMSDEQVNPITNWARRWAPKKPVNQWIG